MVNFWRARRVDLGTYVAPERRDPVPVERVVDEGLLIATSAVRMAVKNRLIVDALRENRGFDPDSLSASASDEYLELARQNDASASRVWRDGEWDDEPRDTTTVQRHRSIFTGLASALREAADDDALTAAIVAGARDDALEELVAFRAQIIFQPEADELYERERDSRIRLVEVDLADLERRRKASDTPAD